MMVVGYWLLTGFLVLALVCLGIVAGQRDKARTALDLYRAALIRVDPDEARALAFVTAPMPRRRWRVVENLREDRIAHRLARSDRRLDRRGE